MSEAETVSQVSWEITGPRDTERNMICDSWRRGMQDAPAYRRMPTRAFVWWANAMMRSFLGNDVHRIELREGDFLLVARDKQRPTYALGWLLATDAEPGCAIAWVYTKLGERRQGVAADLIATAIERCDPGPVTYGVHTRWDSLWESFGMEFRPIQEFEVKTSRGSQ